MDVTSPATSSLRTRLANFFYDKEVPYGLAVLRIVYPWGLLFAAIPRWFHARELYTTDGAPAPLWLSYGYPDLLPEPSGPIGVALCTLMVFFLCTLSVGWMTRISALGACLLVPYIGMLDSISTMTKYTVVSTHVFLLLALSHCGDVWSVDAWIRRRKNSSTSWAGDSPPRSELWPRRMIQLLIGIIYLGAAFTKMQTPAYFSGDQLYNWLITNVNFANPVGEYLSLYPPMLVVFGLVTIVWECLFLFLAWKGTARLAMLGLGVLFHVMTLLTLGLVVFPIICIAIYATFFDEAEYRRFFARLRRFARTRRMRLRLRWPSLPVWVTPQFSTTAFCVVSSLFVLGGLKLEQMLDPYQLRGDEGPLALKPLSEEQVQYLMSWEPKIRPVDKLLEFDVGSITLAGMLADSRDEFEQGETALVQCSVIPPHEDLWVVVQLHDAEDRLLVRRGQVLTREQIRSHFAFPLEESLPPGEYDFVLHYSNQEIARRRFTLEASPGLKNRLDRRQAAYTP